MADYDIAHPLTWMGGDRRLARRVARPVRRFLEIEAAGGIVLLIATVAALVWANSPWDASYHEILETHLTIQIGDLLTLDEPVELWVNDALMAIFFFVVGLEIKRELVAGELRDPRAAALPAIAAVGGMIVPALIYVAFTSGAEGSHGWGIPMATDIAFALGVVSLLGSRVPSAMKVFLLTLAIVDDIGAIVVIAIFYTDDLSMGWLLIAVATFGVVLLMRVVHIWYVPAYLAVGIFLWLAVFESGIHATIAGVVLGIVTPARPLVSESLEESEHVGRAVAGSASAPVLRRASFDIREQVSVAERLQDVLHPFSSFLIGPIFALANAGIALSPDTISEAASSRITLGVVFGLVVGKLIGVSLFTFLGVRSGISRLPRGASWNHVIGLAAVAGVGFTVSLFITGLAFDNPSFNDDAKLGVFAASVVAAILGSALLMRAQKVIEVSDDAVNL
jgi:NhaA family Na+:H+ antiporter